MSVPQNISTASAPRKALFSLLPWACKYHPYRSIIEAHVEAADDWQPIAEIRQTAFLDAEATSTYITEAVNHYAQSKALVQELVAALELCLENDGQLS